MLFRELAFLGAVLTTSILIRARSVVQPLNQCLCSDSHLSVFRTVVEKAIWFEVGQIRWPHCIEVGFGQEDIRVLVDGPVH